jgi:hypothetical protein
MDAITVSHAKVLVDELTRYAQSALDQGQPMPGPATLRAVLRHAHPDLVPLFVDAIVEAWCARSARLGLLRPARPQAVLPVAPRTGAAPLPARPRPVPPVQQGVRDRHRRTPPGLGELLRRLEMIRPG